MIFNIETIIVLHYSDCDILLTMASDVSHNPTKYRKWWYKNERTWEKYLHLRR